MNHLVIMAGGVGSRFWPLSTKDHPKQFLDVLGCGHTLLQLTVKRFEGLVSMENVWIVTSKMYAATIKEQLPDIPATNILLEPCRHNTAPCIAYASYKIKRRDPKANIVVAPSDHVIADVAKFRGAIERTLKFAGETDAIVTLGMHPTYAETGYGYIKANLSTASSRTEGMYRVDAFKEKPDHELAEKYLKEDHYFWNSGIFVWNISTIVNAFRIYQEEMAAAFEEIMPYFDTEKEQEKVDEAYEAMENISIDYAVLEHSDEIYVYPSSFGWSDLGTWGSLRDHMPQDQYGNAKVGKDIDFYESHKNIVHTENLKKVVVQGLDGYVVAEKDGVLLICQLSEEQRIKLFHE